VSLHSDRQDFGSRLRRRVGRSVVAACRQCEGETEWCVAPNEVLSFQSLDGCGEWYEAFDRSMRSMMAEHRQHAGEARAIRLMCGHFENDSIPALRTTRFRFENDSISHLAETANEFRLYFFAHF
jgi:hypothetical protein